MKSKAKKIITLLRKEYPEAKTSLNFRKPLDMLVSTILSAQCTDKRVNKITKNLFRKYKKPEDYANADLKGLEKEIKSCGFYRNKANNIKNASKMIIEKYNGKVPKKMQELLKLPGVGRKTANIVLWNSYGIISGIAIDTHCKRLANRLGLTKHKNPEKIEKDLMKMIDKKNWPLFSNLLIAHGKKICKAINPHCKKCILNNICLSAKTK